MIEAAKIEFDDPPPSDDPDVVISPYFEPIFESLFENGRQLKFTAEYENSEWRRFSITYYAFWFAPVKTVVQ
jgi:hypothetical protein